MGFLADILGGGGGEPYSPPTPPDQVQSPAVQVSGSAKSKRMSMANRKRMAAAGQSSLIAGGGYGSGSTIGGTMSTPGGSYNRPTVGKSLMGN